jgi:exonuclease SbcC
MKIKEVQISNFRAFNDVKSSTFNFLYNKDEISDLISIYAPNGFGKTSFYDAVEWGVTGKIERFDLVGDFDKTRKENKKGGNKNILQHIGATENGFVKVITEKATFTENITNAEYNHKKEPRNKFFRDVVLSQEMIDNFLKEQTAEERYNKFVESYPEVTKYNNTYKNIGSLLSYILQETKRIEKEKGNSENKQLKIDFDLEFKKFDQINDAIQFLNANQEAIDIINKETFNETLYDILTSQVKSRLVSLQLELDAKKIRIGNIQIARTGEENSSDNNGSVLNYIDNRKKLEDSNLRIKEIKNIISLIENKEKIQAENNSLKEKLSKEQSTQSIFLSIEKKIDIYILIDKEIIEHEKRITNFNETNLKIEKENNTIKESINQSQNELSQLQKTLRQYQTKINELPQQKSKIELTQKNISLLQKSIAEITESITEKQNIKNALQQKLNQLNYYENHIESDLGLLLEFDEFENQKSTIEEQIKLADKIDIQKKELVKIENKIDSQNQFSTELKEYITRGLEIISKNNSSDCPLCSHKYKSFEELSSRIIENKIFDEQLKESLENKIRIESEISKLNEEINSVKEKLRKHLNELKLPFQTEYAKIGNEIEELVLQKNEKNEELKNVQTIYNEAILFFDNESNIDAFEKNIKEKIDALVIQIGELSKTIQSSTLKVDENNTQLKSDKTNIEIQKHAIDELKKSNESYSEVISFFSKILNSNEIDKTLFDTEKQKLDQTIINLKKDLAEKKNLLTELESKLSSYNLSKEDYIVKLNELENLKTLTLKIYESFENFIRAEFGIDVKDRNKQEIDVEFDMLVEREKNNQKNIENRIERYKIIDALKEDCLKATVSQRIQIEINELKNNLEKLKIAGKKLEAEKKNLERYLEKTIDGFFYTGLINAIYKKIDPHPDYESIEFKCDFGESKPRLQIFTIKVDGDGKETKSVPALYFSTAQINILSLSIFLARALKTKNPETGESVDCIFIDDPIQSMDSINILSFIDLFRGIVTSLGKQLIVSTHEENFHLLLQKKIPKELFNSKFIKFETFGKLEVNI